MSEVFHHTLRKFCFVFCNQDFHAAEVMIQFVGSLEFSPSVVILALWISA